MGVVYVPPVSFVPNPPEPHLARSSGTKTWKTDRYRARNGHIVYRLNTFPLIHIGFVHMLLDTICLIPLLERFEHEYGTLNTAAFFLGRESLSHLPHGR